MRASHLIVASLMLAFCACRPDCAFAQGDAVDIPLVLGPGRPIRIALNDRLRIQHVGQPVVGTVLEPVYAYDRVVIPAGATAHGHVARIESGSTFARARAYATGNFSPAKHTVLQFDSLVLDDGREVPIETVVKGGIPRVQRQVARGAADDQAGDASLTARARHDLTEKAAEELAQVKQKAHEAFASVRSLGEPGELQRLRDAVVQQLPYHPQYLTKGTVYDAELVAPISFGRVEAAASAPAGTAPAPDSILTARLATLLDSAKTPKGTPFEAVLTEPVFSADHQVILPEGTRLTGRVTLASPARRFHRNGQLRFLFERVEVPGRDSAPLLGQLHAVDTDAADRVAVDEEGGTTLENSKTRFIAPALSLLALHGAIERDGHSYEDPDGDGTTRTAGSGVGARGIGGFFGMSAVGAVTAMVTRPLGIALSAYGAARTVYTNVLAKGREVTFAADTPIQVRLAPAPSQR